MLTDSVESWKEGYHTLSLVSNASTALLNMLPIVEYFVHLDQWYQVS